MPDVSYPQPIRNPAILKTVMIWYLKLGLVSVLGLC